MPWIAASTIISRWVLLCCCVIFIGSPARAADTNDVAALADVTQHIARLQQTIAHDQSREVALQQQLQRSELAIAQLSQQADTLTLQISDQQSELEKNYKMQTAATAELKKQQNVLRAQVRLLYQLQQAQSLQAVFDPSNLNRAHRHLTYYNYLNDARSAVLGKIKLMLTTLNQMIIVCQEEEANLKVLLAQKQQQQQHLRASQQERQQVILALEQRTQGRQQELTALTANQQALQNVLTDLPRSSELETTLVATNNKLAIAAATTAVESTAAFKQVAHRLQWPSQGALSMTPAAGVIIKAPAGSPVKAIYAGRVIFASWLRGYGLMIIINHGDGYMSLYARNQALYKKVGENVQPGDLIATIGNSGGFSVASLYFEIRRNGISVDPHNWCA